MIPHYNCVSLFTGEGVRPSHGIHTSAAGEGIHQGVDGFAPPSCQPHYPGLPAAKGEVSPEQRKAPWSTVVLRR